MRNAHAKAKLQRTALEAATAARIGRAARSLLAELVACSWPAEAGDGWAVADLSTAALARRLLVTVRTIRRQLAELEAAGLVRIARGGGRSASAYTLTTGRAAGIREALAIGDAAARRRALATAAAMAYPHNWRGQKRPGTPDKNDRAPRTKNGRSGPIVYL